MTCEIVTVDLQYISLESQKERKENGAENIWGNNDRKFPKFVEKHKFIDLRSSLNPKWDKKKKTIPRYIRVKLLKFEDKKSTLKAAREKQLYYIKRIKVRMRVDFSLETVEAKRQHLKSDEILVNPEFLSSKTIFSI